MSPKRRPTPNRLRRPARRPRTSSTAIAWCCRLRSTSRPPSDSPGRGSEVALEHIRGYLAAKDAITLVRIEGHVSDQPDAQGLSERRALAVARWLVGQGIDCKRLYPVGFGDNKPIADNASPEGRSQNTRIEVHNATLRGRLIGGMPADGGGNVAGDPCT